MAEEEQDNYKGIVEQKEPAKSKNGNEFIKFKINGQYMSCFDINKAISECKVGDYVEGVYTEKGNYKNLKTLVVKPLPAEYKKTEEATQTVMSKDDWLAKEEREYRAKLVNTLIMRNIQLDEGFIEFAIDIVMGRKPKFKAEFSSPLKEEYVQEE